MEKISFHLVFENSVDNETRKKIVEALNDTINSKELQTVINPIESFTECGELSQEFISSYETKNFDKIHYITYNNEKIQFDDDYESVEIFAATLIVSKKNNKLILYVKGDIPFNEYFYIIEDSCENLMKSFEKYHELFARFQSFINFEYNHDKCGYGFICTSYPFECPCAAEKQGFKNSIYESLKKERYEN